MEELERRKKEKGCPAKKEVSDKTKRQGLKLIFTCYRNVGFA
jgi:hypothetical protein